MSSLSLPPFLAKLQTITQSCDPRVAGWNADGTEFQVRSTRFETEVLRQHFKGSKNTFIRQLHFYCFKKLDAKGDDWAFSHPKFMRDMPHLVFEIKRKTRTEAPGPASRDEVQALRTEMVSMREEMTQLKAQVAALLQSHMQHPHPHSLQQQQQQYLLQQPPHQGRAPLPIELLQQQALQALNAMPVSVSFGQHPTPQQLGGKARRTSDDQRSASSASSASATDAHSGGARAPRPPAVSSSSSSSSSRGSSNGGTRKRARDFSSSGAAGARSSSSLDSGSESAAQRLLPFEDGATPQARDPPPADADDGGPRKDLKELGPDFGDLELDEISDLFSTWDADAQSLAQSQSQSQSQSQGLSEFDLSQASGASAGSLGAPKPAPPQQQPTPPLPQQQRHQQPQDACLAAGPSHAQALAGVGARILIPKSASRIAQLPVPAFAGFISKFVEHALLLQQAGLLTGDLDPELEIFVHASLPADSPLKDMLLYATPLVRTVLVNAISDLEATAGWQRAARDAMGPYDARGSGSGSSSFLHRVFIVFEADAAFRKEVTGENFLVFLSFVLKAALLDDGRSGLPASSDAGRGMFAHVFDPHMTPRVRRVMHLAHVKIEEWKRQQAAQHELMHGGASSSNGAGASGMASA